MPLKGVPKPAACPKSDARDGQRLCAAKLFGGKVSEAFSPLYRIEGAFDLVHGIEREIQMIVTDAAYAGKKLS